MPKRKFPSNTCGSKNQNDLLAYSTLPPREHAFSYAVREQIRSNTAFPADVKDTLTLRYPIANSPSLIDPMQLHKSGFSAAERLNFSDCTPANPNTHMKIMQNYLYQFQQQ